MGHAAPTEKTAWFLKKKKVGGMLVRGGLTGIITCEWGAGLPSSCLV